MTKFETTFDSANDGHQYAIITRKRLVYPYENGKRLSDVPIATTITVALQGNCFASLNVKIEGSTEWLTELTNEKIKAACSAMKPYLVRFSNCMVSIYTINGEMRMSATASGVELVSSK